MRTTVNRYIVVQLAYTEFKICSKKTSCKNVLNLLRSRNQWYVCSPSLS